ncbi:PREDICTED: muscarinic acetylcholine receptor M1-like [Priapulus caudatus]|uniref:Histamine H1 receptor n=1 Tax=Priapulus caudatus TaxID=37621 RepID=A0ABM1F524_PRICU|nr:PREDICTED: muscarinic acetylcholine receptor M1-like [Priapulus caudatus]
MLYSCNILTLLHLSLLSITCLQVSNMFIMSLAIADLTVGLFVMPISTAYILTGEWIFELVICKIWLSLDYTASTASILNLFILSLDRYWSITSPLKYLKKRTKKRALIMISIVWLSSALWIVPILSWQHLTNGGVRRIPPNVCDTEFTHDRVFKVTTSIFNFYLPLTMMISLYGKIFHEIRQRSKFDIGIRNTGGGNGKTDGASDSFGDYEKRLSASPKLTLQRFDSVRVSVEYVYDSSDEEHAAHVRSPLMAKQNAAAHARRQQLQQRVAETSLTVHGDGGSATGGGKQHTNNCSSMLNNAVENPLYSKSRQLTRQRSDQKPTRAVTPPDNHATDIRRTISNKSSSAKSNSKAGGSGGSTVGNKLSSKFIKSSRIPRIPFGLKKKVKKSPNSTLRREKKAAKQLGVIMGAFVLCWMLYFVFFMIVAFCDDCISSDLYMASIWLGYFNSTLNPFLYPLCNTNFKRAFKKMLRCKDASKDVATYSRACDLSQGYTGRITR